MHSILRKNSKSLYAQEQTSRIVTVPKANYIAVRGKEPNEEGGASAGN